MNALPPPSPEDLKCMRDFRMRIITSENPAKKPGQRYDAWVRKVERAKAELALIDRGEWPRGVEEDEIPY